MLQRIPDHLQRRSFLGNRLMLERADTGVSPYRNHPFRIRKQTFSDSGNLSRKWYQSLADIDLRVASTISADVYCPPVCFIT